MHMRPERTGSRRDTDGGTADEDMIALLHGYLLDGSGSNLWTQSIARSLCRIGEDVQLVCQEPHPGDYDFVAEARVYPADGSPEVLFRRETPYPGRCVLHRPQLGDTLPVYVTDRYEGFEHVVPMVELPDAALEAYIRRNVDVVETVVTEAGVTSIVANHAVLMSVVARRVGQHHGIPYAVMPHGSALEYAVKPDARLREMARAALSDAAVVFVIGDEMIRRLTDVFPDLPILRERMTTLPLGVDVELFRPLSVTRRTETIVALSASLEGVGRGRRPEQMSALARALRGGPDRADLERIWAGSADYPLKEPDAGLEDALGRIQWEEDDVLLYVGRLIAAKGVQYVLAALPSILRRRPGARLVLVGHGPLREPLETMIHALDRADEALLRRVVELGGRVEDATGPPGFTAVAGYLDDLAARGELQTYLESAAEAGIGERVVFTGYLTHDRLRYLFPATDVAIFPSRVREAGPLVFLEAMAAGVFPLGTYFGGMAASIDATAETLPPDAVERMKLRTPDAERGGIVADIADRSVAALEDTTAIGPLLRQHVEERHDWRAVSRRLRATLEP